ncbi:MAG: recombinase family protein [Dehalococcoidia bacterium]
MTWQQTDEGYEHAVLAASATGQVEGWVYGARDPDREPPPAPPTAERLVARALVSILLRQPLPGFNPLLCWRAGPGGPDSPAGLQQVQEPLTYQEVGRLIWTGVVTSGPAGRRPPTPRPPLAYPVPARREKPARAARSHQQPLNAPEDDPVTAPRSSQPRRRPGRGGHQPRLSPFTATTATAQLLEELGEPTINERRQRTGFMYWRLPGNGRGFALARLSGIEIRKGESAFTQVQAILHTAKQHDLTIGHLVVSTDNTGARRFEYRPDLLLLHELIARGEVDFVCARNVDRIHRNDLVRAQLEDLFITSDTQLYLSDFGHLDWDRDLQHWRRKGEQAEEERNTTFRRTQSGIISTRIAEGRGRPGNQPFGFYYDHSLGEVVVDPVQWPYVVMIHQGYEDLHLAGETGGMRRLAAQLDAAGCPMTSTNVGRILRNPIYVTGEYTVRWNGHRVTANPVKIPDPIPLDLFQRNQERLDLIRGKHTRTPVGFFPLNGVDVIHERCQDEPTVVTKAGERRHTPERILMRGRTRGTSAGYVYAHYPRSPKCCRGLVIQQSALEPPVMRALRQLAANRELQEQWRRAPRSNPAERPRILTPERRAQIATELRDIELLITDHEARWTDPAQPESQLTAFEIHRIMAPLDEKRTRLKKQLEMDEVLAPTPAATPLEKSMTDIARAAGLDDNSTYGELLERLDEVLTDDPPDDLGLLRRRAAIVSASLSSILICDTPDGFTLELRGPLAPPGTPIAGAIGPIASGIESLTENPSPTTPSSELPRTSARREQFRQQMPLLQHRDVAQAFWSSPKAQRPRPLQPMRSVPEPLADWVPTWVSAPIPVPWEPLPRTVAMSKKKPRARPPSNQDIAREAIRTAIKFTGRGAGFHRAAYARVRKAHPELPSYDFVQRARTNCRMSWPDFAGQATGEEFTEVPLSALASNRLEHDRLRYAASHGLLRAVRWGREFFSRQEWVDEYRQKLRPRS